MWRPKSFLDTLCNPYLTTEKNLKYLVKHQRGKLVIYNLTKKQLQLLYQKTEKTETAQRSPILPR